MIDIKYYIHSFDEYGHYESLDGPFDDLEHLVDSLADVYKPYIGISTHNDRSYQDTVLRVSNNVIEDYAILKFTLKTKWKELKRAWEWVVINHEDDILFGKYEMMELTVPENYQLITYNPGSVAEHTIPKPITPSRPLHTGQVGNDY